MRIHVAIATTGRAGILRRNVERLSRQSRPADGIVVVGAMEEDVAGLPWADGSTEVLLSAERGSCVQRNAAIDLLEEHSDIILFMDDDFLPAPDYIANLEDLMCANPALVGVTGWLVADGAQTGAITFDEAAARLDTFGERSTPHHGPCASLYGCNMAVRVAAARGLRFDENLPLYGWQEDVDYTYRLGMRGSLLRTSDLTGIHLGARGGRTSGRRFGYSQVANIIYLRRKGTMPPWAGEQLMLRNIAANMLGSIWPEAGIDRRGRLWGNMLALSDLMRGRIDPRRIEKF